MAMVYYYKNGDICYEGDFANGNFDGNGKLFEDKWDYYTHILLSFYF